MNATRDNVLRVVLDFVKQKDAAGDLVCLSGSVNLLESGLIDSTSFLDLTAQLEEQFGMEFDFLEIDPAEMATPDGIADTVIRLNQNAAQ